MKKLKHNTAAENSVKQYYRSPMIKVVSVKANGILCISKPDSYLTEMEEGNDNW